MPRGHSSKTVHDVKSSDLGISKAIWNRLPSPLRSSSYRKWHFTSGLLVSSPKPWPENTLFSTFALLILANPFRLTTGRVSVREEIRVKFIETTILRKWWNYETDGSEASMHAWSKSLLQPRLGLRFRSLNQGQKWNGTIPYCCVSSP